MDQILNKELINVVLNDIVIGLAPKYLPWSTYSDENPGKEKQNRIRLELIISSVTVDYYDEDTEFVLNANRPPQVANITNTDRTISP
jgi:hypothetical protein